MKPRKSLLLLLCVLAAPAAASVADRFSPADLLAHAALFDGQQVKTHGYLLSVSDRCLSLDAMGFGGGKFLISKPDADAIRAFYRETGSNYIVISGTFRARFTGALPGRAPCGEAGIETITVELEDSRDYPGSEWIR